VNRVSYNGGTGGIAARPTPREIAAEHERHMGATSVQQQHQMGAHNNRSQFASVNHGMPGVAATGRPGEFRGAGVVQATRAGGPFNSGGYHSTNPGPNHSYSSSRGTNPGGGGNHQVMTARANSRSTPSSSKGHEGTASGQNHSTLSAHNQPSRGGESKKQTESHPRETQAHSSRPAGGERSEKHESEPRH